MINRVARLLIKHRKFYSEHRVFYCFCCLLMMGLCSLVFSCTTWGVARESSITISTDVNSMLIHLMPDMSGTFGKSANQTVSVSTDNFTGYSLKIASSTTTNLVNENDDTIPTLASAVSEATFSSSNLYNNRWGYKPNQYISTSNNVNTVVQNSDFLPAPSTTGDLLDITNAANSTANTYTLSFAAKVDFQTPPGQYEYTYVVQAVANQIMYNISYDDNTTETVTNMPSPNPQGITIDGGTPVAQSYGTLSSAVPTMTTDDMSFGGWCDVATTIDSSTGNYLCSGTIYQAGDDYPIDQTADGTNITLYAIWLEDSFPMVWSQMGKCTFNNGTISGSECQDYVNDNFIDTGVALYSNDNYQLDYEVHFTLDTFNPNSQSESQTTMFNDKLSSSVTGSPYGGKSPGVVIRTNGSHGFELKSTYGAPTEHAETRDVSKTPYATAYNGTDVRLFRIDGHIYTSIDNGPLVELQDYTPFNQQFGLSAWFGAYPDNVDCTENCTAAKRYFTGELSNMYIKLGDMPSSGIIDVTFNANGGTPSTTAYKILNGNALTELPTVTKSGWLFDGWWTASSGGQQITTATVPSATTTYWAHWKLSVADAQITNTDVNLSSGGTETITITNSADVEPYTLISSNTSVATVNSSGVITAVGNGTTTITMTGTLSGDTRTISVAVGNLINVNFDSQGGSPSSYILPVAQDGSFGSLPEPVWPGHRFEGWFTDVDGAGTELTTSTVFDLNTPTQYYADWDEAIYVCKIATSLHTETCNQTGNNGCKATTFPNNTITYGSLVNSSTLSAGNAFNCDINYDGTFDDETERFYYFGTENGNAKFVYYQSMETTSSTYDVALGLLPTSSDPGWDNPYLTTFSGDYNGSVARFMTYPEALALCENSTSSLGINGRCLYLLEKSAFANTTITDGIWLEKQPNNANRIQTRSRGLTHTTPTGTTSNASRPTIEVPVGYVEPYSAPATTYEITFNPHNGDSNTTETVTAGTALGNKYPSPDPTYTNHYFQGWYTAVSGGTLVTNQTVPDGDWTYHAQWKSSVALAIIANPNITVEENSTATINVTNSAELEPYTFSSNNPSIATVDASTGVVTGVAYGSTTVTMTGTLSGATKTINITVDDLLPVTQAVIANNDLTVMEGDQITIIVSNASVLEPYTFSSNDTSIATVNANTGVITGVSAGTTNIIMTGTNTGLTKTLEVDVTAAPVPQHTVTFNANGGTTPSPAASYQVDDNTAVGSLPTTSRTNYKFFGWYKDDGTFYEEVYPDEVITSDVTYYARWIEDTASYPIVFSEINACTFGGHNVNVSGTYCTQPTDKSYVDSAISLYTAANYGKDYEIGFTIVDFDFDSVQQMTLVAAKYENTSAKWPGLAIRRSNSTDYMEFTHSMGGTKATNTNTLASTIHHVRLIREGGVIKYSINNGSFTTLQNLNALTEQDFDYSVWFGASATESKTPQREFIGTLTDMYVKLGTQTDYLINFDPGSGSFTNASDSSRTVTINDPLGALPVPNPPSNNHSFVGWFDESTSPATQVTASTVPSGNKTYVAHYSYQSSNTPVEFDVSNNATRGYQNLIDDWVQSPTNITTFNEASPINNSTWGDTSELSELEFWEGIRDNFVNNGCLIPGSSDAVKPLSALQSWTSGSVDCSKPDAYNTEIGAPLTVHLNNAQGAVVSYAKADDGIIHNMIPGQTYYWEKSDDSTVYGYVTATSNKGTRWVDTGSIRNVRDLGGLPVTYTDGNNQTVTGTLAYGRLFRGEKLNSAPASELTNLGITTEYNVGDEYSGDTHLSDYHLNQVIHYNFDYNSGDENNPNSNYMKAWTAVTNIMTDITNANTTKNVYFHCRVGADRTGTVAYLLEGLLGVPDEMRYEEYALTNVSGLYDRTRYYKEKSSSNNEKFVYMMGFVKTTQDIYDWYMHNPNASSSLIQAFRTAMTVPSNQQQQNSPQNAPAQNMSLMSLNNSSSGQSGSVEQNGDNPNDADVDDNGVGYIKPLGVEETFEETSTQTPVDMALVLTATAAVATGAAVLTLAREDKEGKVEESG